MSTTQVLQKYMIVNVSTTHITDKYISKHCDIDRIELSDGCSCFSIDRERVDGVNKL